MLWNPAGSFAPFRGRGPLAQTKKPPGVTPRASMLGWLMGFEPTTTGVTIRGSTN